MADYQRKDRYYRKAKEQGLPSRASFKIEEILKKYSLVQAGDIALDLGAAPGGWTVMLARAVGPQGRVFAIDLQPLAKPPGQNVLFLQADMQSSEAEDWLKKNLQDTRVTSVFSDMSPKLTGITFKDDYDSYELCLLALRTARQWLKSGGGFVAKIFPGAEFHDFIKTLRQEFTAVKTVEPDSSRKTSREVYLVATGFKNSKFQHD